ncbi:hypothetical protein [Paenibacillus eucommiae]|uniref:Uncharacterized protein n=1 Tax=Paenibacillus eucommiae TaxID=1355755 RepID=A0ABS4IRY8_9BACL|nr:hypothetical protein [Paenibacillus eucommiae]MBP1990342.1 hypothetical protein [Paenibacillus eucommiae]
MTSMAITRPELVDQYFSMIRKLNQTQIDIMEIKAFFASVAEIKTFTPPTVEFMAVLKIYRPGLFHEFRKSLVPSTSMWFLANVSIDVGQAILSLGIHNEEQLQRMVKG